MENDKKSSTTELQQIRKLFKFIQKSTKESIDANKKEFDEYKTQAAKDAVGLDDKFEREVAHAKSEAKSSESHTRWAFGLLILALSGFQYYHVSNSKETITSYSEVFKEHKKNFDESYQRLGKALNEADSGKQQLNDLIKDVSSKQQLIIYVNQSSQSIISLLNQSRNELQYNGDTERSVTLAESAKSSLEMVLARTKNIPDIQASVNILKLDVYNHLCESYLLNEEYFKLERAAREYIDVNCDCPDATYYMSRALFHLSLEKSFNDPSRPKQIEQAIEYLQKTTSNYGSNNYRQVILAAMLYEFGNHEGASSAAQKYIKSMLPARISYEMLSDRQKAYHNLATSIFDMTNYTANLTILGNLNSGHCSEFSDTKLDRSEVRMFEKIFESQISRKEKVSIDKNRQEEMAVFCGTMISNVRKLCINGSRDCPGCVPPGELRFDLPLDIIIKYSLPPYKLPFLSTDKDLGVVDGNTRTMYWYEIEHVPSEQIIDNFPINTKVPKVTRKDQEYKNDDTIPERRYFKPEFAPAPPGPAPVPAEPNQAVEDARKTTFMHSINNENRNVLQSNSRHYGLPSVMKVE